MAAEHEEASKDSGGQKSMFESNANPGQGTSVRGSAHMQGTRALERLRDRVQLAVRELKRLRDENQSLHRQIDSLRNQGADSVDGTSIHFTDSPGELRDKVESFIEAIDRQIGQSDTTGDSDANERSNASRESPATDESTSGQDPGPQ